MSKDEIKYEINKVLDHLPDEALEKLLSYLKRLDNDEPSFLFDKMTIEKILSEDKELLQKLAK
ncbi:MAG TPA: hypothetical protein VKT28_09945 [Puia sp.]|nr:hypothetical protein [Puia sp.]